MIKREHMGGNLEAEAKHPDHQGQGSWEQKRGGTGTLLGRTRSEGRR